MIKITIQRNGETRGVSIIATRDTLNPYFLFGAECSEENQALLAQHMDEARALHARLRGADSLGGVIPEYALRSILLWQHVNFNAPISYPEIGCIPGVQSFLMTLIFVMHKHNPDKTLEIDTVSEYMVRMSQLLVANGLLSTEDIAVFDTAPEDGDYSNMKPAPLEFQLPNEFAIA